MTRPGPLTLALNLGKALVKHVADGLARVEDETLAARLSACARCPLRRKEDWVCTHEACGCHITVKATWRSEDCPLGKWPKPGLPQASGDAPSQSCGCGNVGPAEAGG